MAKNTSILLGNHFDEFIKKQIESGKFSSVSEVIRAALRLFEFEETKKDRLIEELKKGENSDFVSDFNPDAFLNKMHKKYVDYK